MDTPSPQTAPTIDHDIEVTLSARITNLLGVTVPLAALVVAIVLLWGWAFEWQYLVIMAGMYLVTGFGITIGYHRLFTHKSFRTPRPIAALLAIMGAMAAEGSLMQWVSAHRLHHQHSDHEGDPHSPHLHGNSLVAALKGMWHAHIGWALKKRKDENTGRNTRDLNKDPWLRFVNRLFPVWVGLGLLIPAVLGGLMTMSWMGVLLGFLWGGLVRVLMVHHVTWSINSVCHIWGARPYESKDHSRNNVIFGILALGEGWHNNHHAFPSSPRHGLSWWQFDASYVVIRAMKLVGLASDLRVPHADKQAQLRR
ncbi:acyl-CoA desaturase [Phycisphaeraceae bacterium D3-23]